MSISLGSSALTDLRLGTSQVSLAYLGTSLVYQSSSVTSSTWTPAQLNNLKYYFTAGAGTTLPLSVTVATAISKKAAGAALKIISGPIGLIAAGTIGITKFFIGKAEEKKRFEAEKKEYATTINQVERLHTRKAEIENEIEGILSGKITLDVPPLSDTKLTATQRYLQRYGKSVLDKIVVSGG
jgi:hypothetical protein